VKGQPVLLYIVSSKTQLHMYMLTNGWLPIEAEGAAVCLRPLVGGDDTGGSYLVYSLIIKTSDDGMITFAWLCIHSNI
jgi:hypothetical protein